MTALGPVGMLLLRIAVAVLVFLLVTLWPVPLILLHFGFAVPEQILWIVGFILAVATFLRGQNWIRGTL